jgi:hypothetical protein
MFLFENGDGGGFRMRCQPLTNHLAPSDSLPIETRRTRWGGQHVNSSECVLLGFPADVKAKLHPGFTALTSLRIHRSLEGKKQAAPFWKKVSFQTNPGD